MKQHPAECVIKGPMPALKNRSMLLRIVPRRPKSSWAISLVSAGLPIMAVIALWEVLAYHGHINTLFFSSPSILFSSAVNYIRDGILVNDLLVSVRRALIGFALGSALGLILGLCTGSFKLIRSLLEPLFQILRPIPAIALVPLVILWLGVGEQAKIFLIGYGAFFPTWLAGHIGSQRVPKQYLWIASSLGANRHQLFRHVVLPGSLPYIVAGLRIGLATSFIILVAAEMTGANSGLGFRIIEGYQLFQTDKMLLSIFALGFLGALVDWVFYSITSIFVFW